MPVQFTPVLSSASRPVPRPKFASIANTGTHRSTTDAVQLLHHDQHTTLVAPLVEAVRSNQADRVATVLNGIPDPQQRREVAQQGFHPLMEHDTPSLAVLDQLLASRIQVNTLNPIGDTALHTLALKDNPNPGIWKRLIEAGIAVNQRDEDGHTAWHYVVQQRPAPNAEHLYLLLKAGARMENDGQRRIAYKAAMSQRHPALMAWVLQHGHQIQPMDNPSDFLAERLLNNRDNYRVFLQHLGREQTTKFLKAVLEAEVRNDIHHIDLGRFSEKRYVASDEALARRFVDEVLTQELEDTRHVDLAQYTDRLREFAERQQEETRASLARRIINQIVRPFRPYLRQLRQEFYSS